MKIMLDTNALLWQLGLSGAGKLGSVAKRQMLEAEAVYVSSITLVEIHVKTMVGKLNAPPRARQMVLDSGDEILEFTGAAADGLRNLTGLDRHDPFDRMLLAHARAEGLIFLTGDQFLLDFGYDFVVDARK